MRELNNDYFLSLKELLLTQYKNSPNLNAIIELQLARGEPLVQCLQEVGDSVYVFNATGEGLNFIGRVFNVDRNGANDTEYRALIQQKINTIYSGEGDSIISILKSQYGASYVWLIPSYPAGVLILTDGDLPSIENAINNLLIAGVSAIVNPTPTVPISGREVDNSLELGYSIGGEGNLQLYEIQAGEYYSAYELSDGSMGVSATEQVVGGIEFWEGVKPFPVV